MLAVLSVFGCGGGGGGTPPPPQPTIAVIKISADGTLPQDTAIGGVNITLNLPSGVTVKASPSVNPDVLITDPGVVVPSGAAVNASAPENRYDAATKQVTISVVQADGFLTGEFVTVTCDIAVGSFPKAADFSLGTFQAYGINLINSETVDITAALPTRSFTASIN